MRTHVTFRHPEKFVPVSDAEGILATSGAQWFTTLLRKVPDLEVVDDLCQEDWGVVIFARRNGKSFCIGLGWWESEGVWLADFHHGVWSWLQRFSASGKSELRRLLADVHSMLTSEPTVSTVQWHDEKAMHSPTPTPFATPLDD